MCYYESMIISPIDVGKNCTFKVITPSFRSKIRYLLSPKYPFFSITNEGIYAHNMVFNKRKQSLEVYSGLDIMFSPELKEVLDMYTYDSRSDAGIGHA